MKEKTYRPQYKAIEKYLETLVASGRVSNDVCLPSERDLARRFDVSNKPVRKAISNLVDRGLLEQVRGKGAFIRNAAPAATDTVAVLHTHGEQGFFASSFYSAIMAGIQLQAQEAGLRVTFRQVGHGNAADPDRTLADVAPNVDGMLLVDPYERILEEWQPALERSGRPAVLVNTDIGGPDLDAVTVDNRRGAEGVTRFLLDSGHRHIACVYNVSRYNPVVVGNFRQRIDAFRSTMAAAGVPADRAPVNPLTYYGDEPITRLHVSGLPDRLLRDFETLLKSAGRPTALMCLSDETAILVLKLCRRLGIGVPDDMTVTGFDGIKECDAVIPALTTVESPLVELGVTAMERLSAKRDELARGIHRVQKIVLPSVVRARESHTDINALHR